MNNRKKLFAAVLACCLCFSGCKGLDKGLSQLTGALDNVPKMVNEAKDNPEKVANDIVNGANDLLSGVMDEGLEILSGDTDTPEGDSAAGTQNANTNGSHSVITNVPGFFVPNYAGQAYVTLNNNQPTFPVEALTYSEPFEIYSELDYLGRCGAAFANVCKELMPTEDRGSIGSVTPTGWQSVKYDFVDGGYLYNRCHLIGYQLAGENANEKNLITGTRYLNIKGMLPFENWIDDYVKETGNHVLYRVIPVFEDWNLVASGVIMEGYSVEDQGEGICFNVFCFNVQPGVDINYATGESKVSDNAASNSNTDSSSSAQITAAEPDPSVVNDQLNEDYIHYVVNTNTKKFHRDTCSLCDSIDQSNREDYFGTRQDCLDEGYSPCGKCNP